MKKIAIDATGAKTFGAKYNISCLVDYFSKSSDCSTLYIYTSEPFLKNYYNEKIIIKYYSITNIFFIRIFWTLFILPIVTLASNISLVYCPFDIGPFLKFRQKYILGIKNPNSILPNNLKSLKYPNTHELISKISIHFADKVVFPSKYASEFISEKFNIDSSKILYVHHGFDNESWTSKNHINTDKSKYIFFCSLFYKFKNLELLLTIMNIIVNQNKTDIKLYLCGKFVNDDYKSLIDNLIYKYRLKNHIVFYRDLPKNEIVTLYNNAYINIIPTKFETFGHMYLEAITTSVPVYVYDTPIAREILENSVTYFTDIDLDHIAEKIHSNDFDVTAETISSRKYLLNKYSIKNECINTFKILNQ